MSADSTENVVQLFGYFQDKRFTKALEHLASAYEANLDAEQAILEALVLIGWQEDKMMPLERTLCKALNRRAEIYKHSGKRIKKIMRSMSFLEIYDDSEESSEG